MDKKPRTVEELEELTKILEFALWPVIRGDWDSFSLKGRRWDVTLTWDKNCEDVVLTGKISP